VAKQYDVYPLALFWLGMTHGHYTGGQTQAARTKEDLDENLLPFQRVNISHSVTEIGEKQTAGTLTFDDWDRKMRGSVGATLVYECEHLRNGHPVDKCLRPLLDELHKMKPKKQ